MENIEVFNNKVLKQVYVILNEFPKEQLEKIPKNVYEYILRNKDNNYNFEINQDFELNSNSVLPGTIRIMEILFLEYIATEEEKNEIIDRMNKNEKEYQEKIRLEYNVDFLNKRKKSEFLKESNNLPIEVKKENFFIRIIKKLFGGKNNGI